MSKKKVWTRVSKLLRTKRLEKDLSQEELGKMLKYKNAQVISNIERGLAGLPPHTLKKISEILETPHEIFVDAMVSDYREHLLNQVANPSLVHKVSRRVYS